jgi:glutamate-1-semialdehyde 2,1-aminomutase
MYYTVIKIIGKVQMTHASTWYDRASNVLPAGVNSPVRKLIPSMLKSAQGAYITTIEDETKIDYITGFGPAILGHSHPKVVAAIEAAAAKGLCYGATHPNEVILAEMIREAIPSMEMMRMVSTGTEACMTATRIARAATHRSKIIKCMGGYHGHSDQFLVAAGSGAEIYGSPSSPGVTKGTAADTLLMPYNDLAATSALFAAHPQDIAAIIIEPIAGNMGLILPKAGYLQGLRDLCDQFGSLLIFDEVITGFHIRYGSSQNILGVCPDLTILGKVIGGGLPIAAVGGARGLMEVLSPMGQVYQAGTLSGSPLAVAAGIATLEVLQTANFYEALNEKTKAFAEKLAETSTVVPFHTTQIGSMFGMFFTKEPVTNLAEAAHSDHEAFGRWYQKMWAAGISLPPSLYEIGFVSLAHGPKELEDTLTAAKDCFTALFP